MPAYGTFSDLEGLVSGVGPAQYHVATYIRVGDSWWTKPTAGNPTVPIQPDGSFTVDITTGGLDHFATEIASFLIPISVTPPLALPSPALPGIPEAVATIVVERGPPVRTVAFANRSWTVKRGDAPVGPGPNYFTDREEDVWADEDGLHLTISFRDSQWWSTEVILNQSLGYGTYVIVSKGRVDLLDPNAILGIFTWDPNAPEVSYRELDFEHAKWGDADNPTTSQFAVQPCNVCPGCGQCLRFSVNLTAQNDYVTHVLEWQAGTVTFAAYLGRHVTASPPANQLISEWTSTGAHVPAPGLENIRLNLWLLNGLAPMNGLDDEIVITDFKFSPIWADFANAGAEDGTEAQPFYTVQEAVDAVLAGGAVKIKGDSVDSDSPETPTIDTALRIEAVNGAVSIGGTGAPIRSKAKSGFISGVRDD